MKKIIVFVALIAGMVNATQAQSGAFRVVVSAPAAFDLKENHNLSKQFPDITLSGSEKGISYQLYMKDKKGNSVPVGNPIKGTGECITFAVDTSGNYSAIGTRDDMPCCQSSMNGSVSIKRIANVTLKAPFDPGTLSGEETSDAGARPYNPGSSYMMGIVMPHTIELYSDFDRWIISLVGYEYYVLTENVIIVFGALVIVICILLLINHFIGGSMRDDSKKNDSSDAAMVNAIITINSKV